MTHGYWGERTLMGLHAPSEPSRTLEAICMLTCAQSTLMTPPCFFTTGHQNANQNRAQFSIYSMLASPLIMSGPVLKMTPQDVKTYTNPAVIAVNQDRLGRQAIPLVGTQLCGGSDASPPPPLCQNMMLLGKVLLPKLQQPGVLPLPPSAPRESALRAPPPTALRFALLAVNVGPKAADVACNTSCLTVLLGAKVNPLDTFATEDVWTGVKGNFTGATGWTAVQVSSGPGVQMIVVEKIGVIF